DPWYGRQPLREEAALEELRGPSLPLVEQRSLERLPGLRGERTEHLALGLAEVVPPAAGDGEQADDLGGRRQRQDGDRLGPGVRGQPREFGVVGGGAPAGRGVDRTAGAECDGARD